MYRRLQRIDSRRLRLRIVLQSLDKDEHSDGDENYPNHDARTYILEH